MMEIFYFRSGTTAEKEGCYVAPDGWYERDSKGLRYLGESILEPMPTEVQAGAEPDSRAEAATEKPEKDSRTSQNQTVSSGVEGAHEGTTADKSVALAESSLSSPPQNSDLSAPTIPEISSTQPDTTTEKI